MSHRLPNSAGDPASDWWRSLAEREGPAAFRTQHGNEFSAGATSWPPDLSRRQFLQMMGASLALAGMSGCGRAPDEEIVPYVTPPEILVPGQPLFYATAMPVEGYARGILVESHLGRPTKIEGNPDHPESLGATDAITQAAILSLYDPDRSRAPLRGGQVSSWTAFEREWLGVREEMVRSHGRGLALLTEPTTSRTTRRMIHRLLDVFPDARWYQHSPLARYAHDEVQPDLDFAAAEVVFAIGSDCLFRHPASIRYARGLARRRRIEEGRVPFHRFFAIEPTPTVTGSMADYRLPASPRSTRLILDEIARTLETSGARKNEALTDQERNFVSSLVREMETHAPAVVCVAGPEQPDEIVRWARAFNGRFGAVGRTLRYLPDVRSDGDPRAAGTLTELARSLEQNAVKALFVLSANPVYTAPADLEFSAKLKQVSFTAHLGEQVDETAALCHWHLPESNFLETWSDLRGYDGTAGILQPLIAPLYASRSAGELLDQMADTDQRSAYDLVRETWQAGREPKSFESDWHRWLNSGKIEGTSSSSLSVAFPASFPSLAVDLRVEPITLTFVPDPTILDGRWANNGWLQELPKPMTHLVWDNAVLVSPAFAAEYNLSNGDVIELNHADHTVGAALWVMPGQAPRCLTLSLGYGRKRVGAVGTGRGFNAYRLRTTKTIWQCEDVTVRKLAKRYSLVTTQHHFAMEGRDLVRVITPEDLHRQSAAIDADASDATRHSLFPDWPRGLHAWGMSIDLSTCIGCNTCVVACQAENNTPTVGKEQVARGREMHWIRVDRYFSGEPANPRMVHQPVPCMQCENAPCELVCPVAATVHSSEGLNDMVYNRCVGTRYCSNNCPYKVRRFNFLTYNPATDSPLYLQKNPDVTVRERGVMEKCTYCVQRINAGRIAAEKESRPVRDGEIRPACQQACPVEAIVFGDLADPASRVNPSSSVQKAVGLACKCL